MSSLPTDLRERLDALVQEARAAGLGVPLAAELGRLASELGAPEEAITDAPASGSIPESFGMVGDSEPMRELFQLLERVAPSDVPVLIQGETGVGKELVAKALHEHSPRAGNALLAENCAAVPANLLESELFGHKKGAFTGATADRPGHFVAADGGTVFLDEIGDMPLQMQAKLLRVLQDGEVRPVGSNRSMKVDVRVVAATHRDLPAACKQGTFREDLYFRLNVITLHVPALRDRRDDIPQLVRFFARQASEETGRPVQFTGAALVELQARDWPGNVRQLQNEVRRAVALGGERIDVEDLGA